jgi:DnaJ family protein A protein 2
LPIVQFKKITEANEILSNPEKRELYDKYGMEGVKNGGGGQGDINDLLGGLFGFGGGGRKESGPKKMKGKLRELNV